MRRRGRTPAFAFGTLAKGRSVCDDDEAVRIDPAAVADGWLPTRRVKPFQGATLENLPLGNLPTSGTILLRHDNMWC